MKKFLAALIAMMLALAALAGCSAPTQQPDATEAPAQTEAPPESEAPETPDATEAPAAGVYTPGTYSATTAGFGGDVTVTIEVDAEKILNVTVTGDNETAGIGGRAVEELPAALLEAQSAEVDGVSGATVSSTAIKLAMSQAIAQAKGEEVESALSMTAGTYTAKVKGFGGNVIATVKVSADAIEEIGLENEYIDNPLVDYNDPLSVYTSSMNMETPQIFKGVQELLPGRVIAAQSVAVDAITGATATSNAALSAIAEALRQAGAEESAIYRAVEKTPGVDETYDCDVVVVGAGTSGSSAAAQAKELGANVVLIEKSARIGGSGALSTGPMAINSKTQLAWNQTGDADAVFKRFMELSHWYGKGGVFRKFLTMSGDTADWLVEKGFQWNEHGLSSIPGEFGVTGVSYLEDSVATMSVYEAFLNMTKDVDTILTETTATSILTDAEGNAVGVTAVKDDGTKVTVNAKAVIMSTGGFGGNKDMLEKYTGSRYVLFGVQQNDGSGFEMMKAVGAAERNPGGTSCHLVCVPAFVTGFDEFDANIPFDLLITPTLLQVNQRGERFSSETVGEDSMLMGANYHAAQGEYYYTLISKPLMDGIAKEGTAFTGMVGKPLTFSFKGQAIQADVPMPNIEAVLEAAVEQGLAYKGDTIAELAKNAGMDEKTLEENVARYNELCAGGADLDFNKKSEYMCALGEEGPFYAIVGQPEIYGSLGSVDVDAHTQVLREDGTAIGGLYATGLESIGALFDGVAYTEVGGVALGWGFNSGRIAAQSAVEAIK